MSRQRRMLWASVSTSIKVNNLSLKAALLWTWAIPRFDDEGFQEGNPFAIKGKILPMRRDFTEEEISLLIQEIGDAGLWKIHKIRIGENQKEEIYIEDPYFREKQPVPGERYPSHIKELIKNRGESTPLQSRNGSITELNRTELNRTELNYLMFTSLYNSECPNLIKSIRLSKDRIRKINIRINECSDINWWTEVFKKANLIFLPPNEKYPSGWKPDLEFLIHNGDNAIKVYEGKYDNYGPPGGFGGAKIWLEAKEREDEKTGS